MTSWVTFTRRTEDPKLSHLEGLLDRLQIEHRRNGNSLHAPILQVPEERLEEAWDLLSMDYDGIPYDDIEDDDPMFLERN